jgi:hypothetical protein
MFLSLCWKLHNRYYYHIVHMHHKALTIQTRSLDQRLLAAVITIEIAFGNISNIITLPVTNPIAVFRRTFRLDILLFNQDSYPASIYLWSKIQQIKMLVTCQRFGDLFLYGLVWQYSSVQTKYNRGSFKVMATY